jgi:hypothetical protein
MANEYCNVYKNNPTVGGTDGTAVSTDGSFTSPMSFILDASQNEEKVQKFAIRTETGYIAKDVVISDNNDPNDRLKLCWTENGTFADSIAAANDITDVNTIFYAKAGSSSTENPQTDRSISPKISCKIAAV